MCFNVCVGNAFMRSETPVNICGSLDGNRLLGFSTFFHSTYPDKNVTEGAWFAPAEMERFRDVPLDGIRLDETVGNGLAHSVGEAALGDRFCF